MDILYLGVILAISIAIVLLWGESPGVKRFAHIGGVGWILWVVLQLLKWLLAH